MAIGIDTDICRKLKCQYYERVCYVFGTSGGISKCLVLEYNTNYIIRLGDYDKIPHSCIYKNIMITTSKNNEDIKK